MRASTILLPLLILPACADADTGSPGPLPTTRDQLSHARTFDVLAELTTIRLHATADFPDGSDDTEIALDVTRGDVVVGASETNELVLEDLTLAIADVRLPPYIYPGDLWLTDVVVRLDGVVTCDDTMWSDDEQIAFCTDVALPLRLHWSLVLDDEVYDLAPQRLEGLHGGVLVVPSHDDALALWIGAESQGVGWRLDDLFTLGDFVLDLDARSGVVE
jgi:hypothetical protein